MSDIIYTLENGVYFNITNKCPCSCSFCIRKKGDAVGEAKRLWHDSEPTFEDIKNAIDSFDFSPYNEAVFCGYGEPTNAYDNLIKASKYMKKCYPNIKLRLNTNGLSDLINNKPTAKEICENIDVVSVSLNEPDKKKYYEITKSRFGESSFDAMIKFTEECLKYSKNVRMTVVDVIGEDNIEKSKQIAESIGAKFKCRSYAKGR